MIRVYIIIHVKNQVTLLRRKTAWVQGVRLNRSSRRGNRMTCWNGQLSQAAIAFKIHHGPE